MLKRLSAIALALGTMSGANAALVSYSANVEVITPPASVQLEQLVSDTKIRVFEESTKTLAGSLPVDGIFSGDYPPLGREAYFSIASGTLVTSFLFHADLNGAPSNPIPFIASATFSNEIIGLIFFSSTLGQTDTAVGSAFTSYPQAPSSDASFRGFEFGGVCAENTTDCVSLSQDRRTISLAWSVAEYSDQLRVIVSVPTPATIALLGLGLAGIGAARRNQG